MTDARFQRLAAAGALLSAPLAALCLLTSLAAARFDVGALREPARALAGGTRAAHLTAWSMRLDLLGYYVLLLPLTLLLWRRLRPRSRSWADLVSLCGLGYLLLGAVGASVLCAVWPPLIERYGFAGPAEQGTIRLLFDAIDHAVRRGVWNSLGMVLAGMWWWGLGRLLPRRRRPLARLGVALGAAAWLDAAGTILGLEPVAALGLVVYLLLAPAWALAFGMVEWQEAGVARGVAAPIPEHPGEAA
jgi:hypothetical protein